MEASLEDLQREMKAGRILEFYAIPGQNRGVSIQKWDTAEEMVHHFKATPIATFCNFEFYPLADMEVWAKDFMETVESAEKIMASVK